MVLCVWLRGWGGCDAACRNVGLCVVLVLFNSFHLALCHFCSDDTTTTTIYAENGVCGNIYC